MKRMVDDKEFNELKEDLSQAGNYIMKNGVKYYYYAITTLHNNKDEEEVESVATGLFPITPSNDEKVFESIDDFGDYILQNITDKSIISAGDYFQIYNSVVGTSASTPAIITLSLDKSLGGYHVNLYINETAISKFDLTLYYKGNSHSSLNIATWS